MRERFNGLMLGQRRGTTLTQEQREMISMAVEKGVRERWLILYAQECGYAIAGRPFEYDHETGRLTWVEKTDEWEIQGVA